MRLAPCASLLLVVAALAPAPAAAKKKHHAAGHGHHAEHRHAERPTGADAKAGDNAAKAGGDDAKAGESDAVEPVEAVEAVEPGAADAGGEAAGKPGAAVPARGTLGFTDTLGHLHAAVVHMPIAWTILLFLVDGAALWAGRRELLACGLYLGVLTVLSFAPAVVTGLVRFGQLPQDPENAAPALVHRNFMYACAALALAAAALRLARRNRLEGPLRLAYSAAVTLLLGLTAWGAHLGGKLVYGDDFLPF